jgi:[acyl-carrier-protein] S-malonyltransferase
MSLALLFPGQGVQHEQMLPWLADEPIAAPLLSRMGETIGIDWRQHLADADWAERNGIAQSLMTGTSLAAWQVLRALGLPEPMAVAGYSVGELAAFCVAGAFDEAAALMLAEARAAAMDRSAAGHDGALMAVWGASAEAIAAACAKGALGVAIRLAPDRVLLGGERSALAEAAQTLASQGAEVTPLRIRVASHTSQMKPAAEAFGAVIDPMAWLPPRCVRVTNLEGAAVRRVDELKTCLAQQLAATVQWQRCMQTLAERRPRCVLEVGAGSSLSRLWQSAYPMIPSRSVDEFASPASVLAWVASVLRA